MTLRQSSTINYLSTTDIPYISKICTVYFQGLDRKKMKITIKTTQPRPCKQKTPTYINNCRLHAVALQPNKKRGASSPSTFSSSLHYIHPFCIVPAINIQQPNYDE